MKIKPVYIINYEEFRSTFDKDADAMFVTDNLQREVEKDLSDKEPHVKMYYAPSYDDEGFALFDVAKVTCNHDTVSVSVLYTGTAK